MYTPDSQENLQMEVTPTIAINTEDNYSTISGRADLLAEEDDYNLAWAERFRDSYAEEGMDNEEVSKAYHEWRDHEYELTCEELDRLDHICTLEFIQLAREFLLEPQETLYGADYTNKSMLSRIDRKLRWEKFLRRKGFTTARPAGMADPDMF